MPKEAGRSGEPGNSRTYHPIQIHTPNPGLLQPGRAKGNMSSGSVSGGKVPGWQKGKYTNQPSKKTY